MESSPKKHSIMDFRKGILIYLKKNSFPQGESRRYRAVQFQDMLFDSTKILGLNSKAKKIFSSKGDIITNIAQLIEYDTYYVSSGEIFNIGPSPRKITQKDVIAAIQAEKASKNPIIPQHSVFSLYLKEINDMKKDKESIEEDKTHIICNKATHILPDISLKTAITISKCIADMMSTSSMSDEENETIFDTIRKLQFHFFNIHLFTKGIFSKINNESLRHLLEDEIFNVINNKELNEIAISIVGPKCSGKTSLLYHMATVTYRKIQVSKQSSQVFVFPMCSSKLNLLDPYILLKDIFDICIQSSQIREIEIYPYTDSIKKWFYDQIQSIVCIPVPEKLRNNQFINLKEFIPLFRKIQILMKQRDGYEEFLETAFSIPQIFCKSIDCERVFYVIDDYNSLNVELPRSEFFPDSHKRIVAINLLNKILKGSSFIVSTLGSSESLIPHTSVIVSTEGFIKIQKEMHISFSNHSLTLSKCNGCPGYIDTFLTIHQKINQIPNTRSHSLLINAQISTLTSYLDNNKPVV